MQKYTVNIRYTDMLSPIITSLLPTATDLLVNRLKPEWNNMFFSGFQLFRQRLPYVRIGEDQQALNAYFAL